MSESKSLVNGIDACLEQTVTAGHNAPATNSFCTKPSSSPSLLPATANSPAADSTKADVRGGSWFTGLTSVVNSPNSYPKWHESDTAVSSPTSAAGSNSDQSSSHVDDDDLEPPVKRLLLQHSSPAADDDVSTTTVVAPLLGQLLSSSLDNSDDDSTATDGVVDSSNADESADITPDDSIEYIQHEGLLACPYVNSRI